MTDCIGYVHAMENSLLFLQADFISDYLGLVF